MTAPTALTFESTSRYAQARPGLRLHYHEAGVGNGPTIVPLHGGGPGAPAWSNFARSGCGHWDQLEKFHEFNRLATNFLAGVKEK